jgi:putative molybdopterin biosynthesis protein
MSVRRYSRKQGFLVRNRNPKHIDGFKDLFWNDVMFINRNTGLGARSLIDFHVMKLDPRAHEHVRGYTHETKTHSAVAAIAHERADVGVAVEASARAYNLGFIPLGEEIFDFLIPNSKITKLALKEFLRVLTSETFARELPSRLLGYATLPETGKIVAQ